MNTDQLESFVAVAEVGSFRGAAEQLHVSQPTVSARIAVLERELNRELFVRSRSGVALTAAGRTFHRHAIIALQTLVQGRQEALLDDRFSGTVTLGIHVYLWDTLAEPWIDQISELLPDVAVRIEPGFSDAIVGQLVNGLLDLGVVFEPRLSSGITVEHAIDDPLILVSGDPEVTERNWMENYVAVYWGREFQNDFAKAYPEQPQPRLSAGLSSLGLAHALRIGGSAVVLARTARPLIEAGQLVQVPASPVFRRPVYLAIRDAVGDLPHFAIAADALRHQLTAPERSSPTQPNDGERRHPSDPP